MNSPPCQRSPGLQGTWGSTEAGHWPTGGRGEGAAHREEAGEVSGVVDGPVGGAHHQHRPHVVDAARHGQSVQAADLLALVLQDGRGLFLVAVEGPDLDCAGDGEGQHHVVRPVPGPQHVEGRNPVWVDSRGELEQSFQAVGVHHAHLFVISTAEQLHVVTVGHSVGLHVAVNQPCLLVLQTGPVIRVPGGHLSGLAAGHYVMTVDTGGRFGDTSATGGVYQSLELKTGIVLT